ncbi:SDR family NAD(P)-dependent oxidoreductase [Mycolicibacterium helvum]|uniref:3-oxoacyl-[acyl-carrier-protein] reductase MabA n=1 Tax=Mycolicibacterium helvum TaxID=1534349 RepID=A0A7I7T178_9MYCO|nr:SDR family oxidoreductase [Mycolicibacterium helvum]BBY62680.1 short-chain dehydrogenase [Mycolicibacterium helvum]
MSEVADTAVRTARDAPLRGRVALVTGGSRGVGAGVARELAAAGAKVAVTYMNSPDSAAQVVSDIELAGGQAISVYASAADGDSWRAAAESIATNLGEVDLLVSNAGVASRGRTIADSNPEEFHQLLAVHALGPLELIRALLPAMRAKDRADIVVISSAIVDACLANTAPYAMAKAAMETACRVLAREERDNGIRVNIISPGLVDTDMGAKLVRAGSDGGTIEQTELNAPFGRICKPGDIARLVVFLAGPGGEYITGQRIVVDGGGEPPPMY